MTAIAVLTALALASCQQAHELKRGIIPDIDGSPEDNAPALATINQTPGVTNNEIVIGSCAPLSGMQAERGKEVVNGGRLYFDNINQHGGINGRKLTLVSCDDKYDADEAMKCFEEHLRGKVFLGTLFQGSATATKYVHLSDSYHMPMVGFYSGADFIINPVHPYVFQLRASYRDEAAEQITTLLNKLKKRRIAIVYQNDAFGAACRSGLSDALRQQQVEPVAELSIERMSTDVTPVIERLKAADPDAVVFAVATALPELVTHCKDINAQIVVFSTGSDLLLNKIPAESENVLVTQVVPLVFTELPTVRTYIQAETAAGRKPNFCGFEGYLIAKVVVAGLQKAGRQLTRDGFVKALETMEDVNLGLGNNFRLTYNATRHDGFRGGIYWTQIKGGKLVKWAR